MIHDLTRERLGHWISDFTESDAGAALPAAVREHAHGLLHAWLVAACERRDVEPEDLEREDLRDALLEHVARLDVPAAAHAHVPSLCRDLLANLEEEGRMADGRELGLFVAALRPAYERAARGDVEPITRPGAKLGRNDPCPCGSGKKFKRCCMRS